MARSRITGDFGKIQAWAKLHDTLPDAIAIASASAAEELVGLTKDRFRSETAPSGNRWKRKKRRDGRKVLSGKTSRLKGGWHVVRSSRHGFTIAPSVNYAAYHQTGTRYLDARKMVPEGRLPPAYEKALEETVKEALSAHLNTGSGGGMGIVAARVAGLKRTLNIKSLIRKLANAAEE